MTNDEINKYIHTEIMGKCWHERQIDPKGTGGFKVKMRCQKCGDSKYRSNCVNNPNYCSDSSPRSLLTEVLTKVFDQMHDATLGISAKSSAEQIARACVEAWRSK